MQRIRRKRQEQRRKRQQNNFLKQGVKSNLLFLCEKNRKEIQQWADEEQTAET